MNRPAIFIAFVVSLPGQYFDAESGLHSNFYRTYDPATGRYLEADPIGQAGGLNPYAYVAGNPVNLLVLLGLSGRGRLLVVAHTDRGDRIRLITARLAPKRERRQYEEG